jgi:monovalent cation:H+ antiporter-2, CPA2 family
MHDTALIATLAAGLGLAFLLGLVAVRLRLPPLVGYLMAGIAVGPFTPGFVADSQLASQLAEVGVILLMFGVGIHFSPGDLLAVRRIALPGAVVQILAATGLGALVAHAWGWSWTAGLVFGLCLSVASTVVLLRALEDQQRTASIEGRIAVGWLIIEDFATVLVLVLLPTLARDPLTGLDHGASSQNLLAELALTLGKMAAFIVFIWLVGRRCVPWILEQVARTGSRELFTLAILAVALGVAVGASALFDVSFALGAFAAGVVVGETDLSHRAASDALPLQEAFGVLFFVAVGMLFDPTILVEQPLGVVATLSIIVFGKSFFAFLIVLAFRYPLRVALFVSASLAQIGEFSFILAALATGLGILPEEARSLIVAGALISITINPLVFHLLALVGRWMHGAPALTRLLERSSGDLARLPPTVNVKRLNDHVVIVGHGRVGGPIADALQRRGVAYLVIEQNREEVERLRARGLAVVYGDATRPGIFEVARAEHARVVVLATPDPLQTRVMLDNCFRVRAGIATIVRTHSDEESAHLARRGAARVIMGERELATAMLEATLETYDRERRRE